MRPCGLTFADRSPGHAVLLIRIRPGKQLRVVAVAFAGARHFTREFLRDQVFSYLDEDLPGSAIGTPVDSEVIDELHRGESEARKRERPVPLDFCPPRRRSKSPRWGER